MKLRYVLSIAVLSLIASVVYAGTALVSDVDVNLDDRRATGQMVAARYSDNDVEFIGCGTRNFDDGAGGVTSFAFCQARDIEGDQFACLTTNVGLIDSVEAINDFSFIDFRWNEDGDCTAMGFSTQSFLLPEGLDRNDPVDGDGDDDDDDDD